MVDEIMSAQLTASFTIKSGTELVYQYSELMHEYINLLINGETQFDNHEMLILKSLEYVLKDSLYDYNYFHFDKFMVHKEIVLYAVSKRELKKTYFIIHFSSARCTFF